MWEPFLVAEDFILIASRVNNRFFSEIGSLLAAVQQMHANGHLWNKSVTEVAPGNEVSTRKQFIITINHISGLCGHPHLFNIKKKSNRYLKDQLIWKGDGAVDCIGEGATHNMLLGVNFLTSVFNLEKGFAEWYIHLWRQLECLNFRF